MNLEQSFKLTGCFGVRQFNGVAVNRESGRGDNVILQGSPSPDGNLLHLADGRFAGRRQAEHQIRWYLQQGTANGHQIELLRPHQLFRSFPAKLYDKRALVFRGDAGSKPDRYLSRMGIFVGHHFEHNFEAHTNITIVLILFLLSTSSRLVDVLGTTDTEPTTDDNKQRQGKAKAVGDNKYEKKMKCTLCLCGDSTKHTYKKTY